MITREFNLYLHAGHSIPLVINANQYDHGEQWLFKLFNSDGTQYVPSSGSIVGIKSDNLGIINSGSVDSQGRVVINETQQMTAAVGKAVFELVIDDGTHGTANFVVLVEPKPGDNADLSESDISMIEEAVEAAANIKPYGSPLVASTVAGMTDHDKVYVYVGSETGYTSGHWYYYDGDSWEDGGVYNSVAVQTDTTLTLSGVAADAKKTGDEISDLMSHFNTTSYVSENLFNIATLETGCYYWVDGKHDSSGYNSSALIPVEEGETYYFQNGNATVAQGRNMQTVRFAVGYDENASPVTSASASNAGSYTVPANIKYLRISSGSTILKDGNYYMVSKYSQPVDYIPYFEPYTISKLKDSANSEQTDQNTSDIETLTASVEQNTSDIADLKTESSGGKKPLIFTAHADSLSANNNLVVCEHSDNKKNEYIELTANFQTFGNLTIAHGKDSYGGGYIIITPSKIEVYYYNGTLLEEFTHGLTISNFINVIAYTKNEHNCKSKISIMSAGGDYTAETTRFYSCRSSVLCNADFAMTNVQMRYTINDAKEDVWIFGDSYVSMGDPGRWATQMVIDGHKHALVCGYGGAKSADEILPFRQYLSVAKPKLLVWTLGMNDGDTSSAVNSNWKTYVDEVIATCEAEGITLILATIPNVPNIINTFKNAYVKASGKRYVDFAKAVNAESTGATWYTGMLDSDNTHPTSLGAKALMRQFLLDVPEVLSAEE